MGKAMEKAKKFKEMMEFKKYNDDLEEMRKDREIYHELAQEATTEWLAERKAQQNKYLEFHNPGI